MLFILYSHVGSEVATAILEALIPMGSLILAPQSDAVGFSELMVVMATLAGAGTGSGHATLFKSATGWLKLWYVLLNIVTNREHQLYNTMAAHIKTSILKIPQ